MKKILAIFISVFVAITVISCNYDNDIDVVAVSVRLGFPDSYDDSKQGLRVELQDATASVFVDSTDADGVAHFTVPSGIYSARSSAQKTTYDWRYFFNGSRDKIVVANDSAHTIELPLTMSKRRVVH